MVIKGQVHVSYRNEVKRARDCRFEYDTLRGYHFESHSGIPTGHKSRPITNHWHFLEVFRTFRVRIEFCRFCSTTWQYLY